MVPSSSSTAPPVLRRRYRRTLIPLAFLSALAAAGPALAALPNTPGLQSMGPINPVSTLPDWYQDNNGVALKLCVDQNAFCIITPEFDPQVSNTPLPITTTGPINDLNFPDELFYFLAESVPIPVGNAAGSAGDAVRVRFVLEAAFLGGVVPGAGFTFLRLNMKRLQGLTPNSRFTVTHPYGSFQFTTDAAGATPTVNGQGFRAEDPPVLSNFDYFPAEMQQATTTHIGPFLKRTGGEVIDPVTGNAYLGDPKVATTVTGSPNGNNFVRVDGPNIGGPGVNSVRTDFFVLQGKVASLPRAPTAVMAAAGNTSATVSWTPAASDAPPVTGYTVHAASNSPGALTPPDLVVTGSPPASSATITGLTNGATYTFQVRATAAGGSSPPSESNAIVPAAPRRRHADLNGDGMSDIVWRNTLTDQIYTYLMTGPVVSSAASVNFVTPDWVIVGTGDFDGDGKADILWRNDLTGQVVAHFMDGAVILSAGSVTFVTPDWTIAGIGDFDGDGKADILWRNTLTGQIYLYLLDGTSVRSALGVTWVTPDWNVAGLGDFNNDGRADILWFNPTSGQVVLFHMDGATILSAESVTFVGPGWQVAGVADFDGNNIADILWFNPGSGDVYRYEMYGAFVVASEYVTTVGSGWTVAEVGDFDDDGRSDILWHHPHGDVYLYAMNGATVVAAQPVATVAPEWQIVR